MSNLLERIRDFDELLFAAKSLQSQVVRLVEERDALKKDLTITKAQLEEAWTQIN